MKYIMGRLYVPYREGLSTHEVTLCHPQTAVTFEV